MYRLKPRLHALILITLNRIGMHVKYLCVCCVVSNELVCKSFDCLLTVAKHK